MLLSWSSVYYKNLSLLWPTIRWSHIKASSTVDYSLTKSSSSSKDSLILKRIGLTTSFLSDADNTYSVLIYNFLSFSCSNRMGFSLRHKTGIAFDYSARFDENEIVCNSCEDGKWGEEERPCNMPFKRGNFFEVFQIFFNQSNHLGFVCNPCSLSRYGNTPGYRQMALIHTTQQNP